MFNGLTMMICNMMVTCFVVLKENGFSQLNMEMMGIMLMLTTILINIPQQVRKTLINLGHFASLYTPSNFKTIIHGHRMVKRGVFSLLFKVSSEGTFSLIFFFFLLIFSIRKKIRLI